MNSIIKFLITILSFECVVFAAPKNTFRPWRIGMGTNPAHPMAVPEAVMHETTGKIAKPKGVKDLREQMPPPAGPEPELQIPEVKRTDGRLRNNKEKIDGRLKKDKDLMMENKAKNIGAWVSEPGRMKSV
jgi:hypothetical protein